MPQIDLKSANVIIEDGGSNSVTVDIGEGNLSWTEKRTIEYTKNRGLLGTVREGDQEPVEVSLDVLWEEIIPSGLIGAADNSSWVEDIIKGEVRSTGTLVRNGVTFVTSDSSDVCAPYACDIKVVYDPTCDVGEGDVHLQYFRWETLAFDLRAGTMAFTGMCHILEARRTKIDSSGGT
jgi:hypothetical protein